MTNETVVAGDDARTRLMSLPNTGRGPGSGSGLGGLRALSPRPNNPNPEREELSYDFIPTGVLTPASQPACLPAQSSLSSPFRLCLWSPPASPAEPGRALTRTGPATALPALPHRLYAAPTTAAMRLETQSRSFLALDCAFLMSGLCEEQWTNGRRREADLGTRGSPSRPSHIWRCRANGSIQHQPQTQSPEINPRPLPPL